MRAIFLNKYFDGKYNYYDLSFEELVDDNNEVLLRLNGVIFEGDPTTEEEEARAREIAFNNLPDYELTEIVTL